MNKIISYSDFLLEANLSSVSTFLKAQYNNIFEEPVQSLHVLFNDFIKKMDVDKNVPSLYQKYLRVNQTNFQNSVNSADSIDDVNKIIADEIKYFYFSLKPVVNKLQNDEFTIEKIFSRSKDKRLMSLMSYEEDRFSNAVEEYIKQAVIPQLKDMSGIKEDETEKSNNVVTTTERINFNIKRILEADDADVNVEEKSKKDLETYKKSALTWVNTILFDLLKSKMQLLNKMSAGNTNKSVDQISNDMKGSNNNNAKKMILNKVINMDNQELRNLVKILGLSEDETGKI